MTCWNRKEKREESCAAGHMLERKKRQTKVTACGVTRAERLTKRMRGRGRCSLPFRKEEGKGTGRMPWLRKATKDVASCEKPW